MKELKRPRRCEDLRRRQPVRRQLRNNQSKLRELRRERDLGAGAEHRDRACERGRVGAHPPKPREHRCPDRRGRDPLQRRDAVTPRRQPLIACRREQLAHKQRIPARQLPARRAERLVGTLVQLRAHNRADPRRGQRPKPDPPHPIIAQELLDLAALATRIARAQTQHQQHGQIRRPPRQVTKPRQRRIIDPLHIIDQHHQRATLSPIRTQPVQAVNRREPVRRRLPRLEPQRPRAHPRNTIKQPPPAPSPTPRATSAQTADAQPRTRSPPQTPTPAPSAPQARPPG